MEDARDGKQAPEESIAITRVSASKLVGGTFQQCVQAAIDEARKREKADEADK